jgi:5-(carboxyamino)imidazole ribonucleotide mutase
MGGEGNVSAVSVILGSNSDMEVFNGASSILKDFDIPFEKRIISAHRTPDLLKDYVIAAEKRGVRVFIAIAGMAAALPGVVASFTTLPVIGVPVALKSPAMGLDALFSVVQMPPGIPVATVALNGGRNGAILAAEILALTDQGIGDKLQEFREKQRRSIVQTDTAFTNS